MQTFTSATSSIQTITRSLARGPLSDAPRSLTTTLGRRLALPLFFLCAALLVEPCAATPGQWNLTGSLHDGRIFHSATLLPDGKVLVAGGTGPIPPYDLVSAELYDPASGTWSFTGSLNAARYEHTATLLRDGRVLVVGGQGPSGFLSSAELYDPATGTWTITDSLSGPRILHTATLLTNGKVLLTGGLGDDTVLASAELYDPTTGHWTLTGSLNTARISHTATLLPDGTVLVAGGSSDGPPYDLRSAELYDPVTATWTVTGSLNTDREWHTAILLSDGKVLVAGGGNSDHYYLTSAELYDPAAGTWTITSRLGQGRQQTQAALLFDGKVLVAGGYKPFAGNQFTASTELYDPATGDWTFTDRLHTPRAAHTGTLLTNGKVLVAAGTDGPNYLASAELYDPGIGAATAVDGHGAFNNAGNEVTFKFRASQDKGGKLGLFSLCDPAAGVCITTVPIRTLSITGSSAEFSGGGLLQDGTKIRFSVRVTDNGKPGTADTISIEMNNGYSAGGTLTSGDIRIY